MLACAHPDDREAVRTELRRTRETGLPYHHIYRSIRPDGATIWCEARARYENSTKGRPVRMLGVIMDISESKLAAERQEVMMQELHHRVKNSLTTVQAIANLSRRSASDLNSFFNAFSSRVVSLSRTHTMLVDRKWDRIGFREILMSELGGFDDGSGRRIVMRGPPIDLLSQTAVSLGMAIHELATNAVKYGALSVPAGAVAIEWRVDADPDGDGEHRLSFHWREHGGPPVDSPERRGFGTNLLQGLFGDHNGSSMTMEFERDGLEFQLAMPWSPDDARSFQRHDS